VCETVRSWGWSIDPLIKDKGFLASKYFEKAFTLQFQQKFLFAGIAETRKTSMAKKEER
jgi:hypothetical protein